MPVSNKPKVTNFSIGDEISYAFGSGIAYGEIAVELIVKHALKGEAVPLGAYTNKKYFWETGEIVAGKTGPTLIIPAFVIDGKNAADPRHWGAIAEKEWGIPYS